MTTTLSPTEVKQLVVRTLREFWVADEDLAELQEHMLIRDGRYMARSYRVDSHMAMWMIDVGILQFYDACGNMLLTVNLLEHQTPQRMAA